MQRRVAKIGYRFSVYVLDITLADFLVGVLLLVPEMVRSRCLRPGTRVVREPNTSSLGKETPWHREL